MCPQFAVAPTCWLQHVPGTSAPNEGTSTEQSNGGMHSTCSERSCVKISVATAYDTDVARAINRRTGRVVHHHAVELLLKEVMMCTSVALVACVAQLA
jgi:hypothetical protein